MLNEFEIIQRYFTRAYTRPDIALGVGDDAALVVPPIDKALAITVDSLVEGVHFSSDISATDLGHRTVAVNLSDLAAMGAKPLWATLALTLPKIDEAWLHDFSAGLFQTLDQYQVALVGGNITRGPLSITLQVVGTVDSKRALRRDAAQVGDLIYVSGTLGERLYRPTPRVELGLSALGFAHAAIDISDGLAQDLQHILTASKVGAEIKAELIPLSSSLKKNLSSEQAYRLALTGGDDYELCLTVPPVHQATFEARAQTLACPVTYIGKIIAEEKLLILDRGIPMLNSQTGYQHFS
jgi:thiamine-monophosphate kinase